MATNMKMTVFWGWKTAWKLADVSEALTSSIIRATTEAQRPRRQSKWIFINFTYSACFAKRASRSLFSHFTVSDLQSCSFNVVLIRNSKVKISRSLSHINFNRYRLRLADARVACMDLLNHRQHCKIHGFLKWRKYETKFRLFNTPLHAVMV